MAPGDRTRRLVVEDDGARRLDLALARALPSVSRARLKSLIQAGCVRIADGATVTDPARRVKPGQEFAVVLPDPSPPAPRPQPIALDVRHEDDDLLVLDKPAGLVVHPAPGNPDGTLVNALIAHCGDSLSGIGGVRRPGIVHRLDKDTSGLMVVAKNDAAHAGLSAQLAARRIERAYRALVWGRPRPAAGEIEGRIGRSPRNRKKMAVVERGGKPALTRYRVERALGDAASLLTCRLATGRTHQIRVHLAGRGHPVLGDRSYGGGLTAARRRRIGGAAAALAVGLGRQALHAARLGFRHPGSGETLRFESALPEELARLAETLAKSAAEAPERSLEIF